MKTRKNPEQQKHESTSASAFKKASAGPLAGKGVVPNYLPKKDLSGNTIPTQRMKNISVQVGKKNLLDETYKGATSPAKKLPMQPIRRKK